MELKMKMERKAYTTFGRTGFGEMGFGKMGFGETGRHLPAPTTGWN